MDVKPTFDEGDSEIRLVTPREIDELLSVAEAVEELRDAFGGSADVAAPKRMHLPWSSGSFLVMPATGTLKDGTLVAGAKLVSVRDGAVEMGVATVQGGYLLFRGVAMSPVALIDGPALTSLRTSAVSALAADYLAKPDASSLTLFGSGPQAMAHLRALAVVRPLNDVRIVARNSDRGIKLIEWAEQHDVSARLASPEAVAETEIVCTCTSAQEPLFSGDLLEAGTNVIAMGAFQPDCRELDTRTMMRGRVFVEDRDAAAAEAGEIVIPHAAGDFDRDMIAGDLFEVCSGRVSLPPRDAITVFKSVGVAMEDLVISDAIYRRMAIH